MKRIFSLSIACAVVAFGAAATGQTTTTATTTISTPGPTVTEAAAAREQANESVSTPIFPNSRAGSLGIPLLTAQGGVAAQLTGRLEGSEVSGASLFARLGQLQLSDSVRLIFLGESSQIDAPAVTFNPDAVDLMRPLPTVQTQTFQSLGARLVLSPEARAQRAASRHEIEQLRDCVATAASSGANITVPPNVGRSSCTPGNYRTHFYEYQRMRQRYTSLFVGARFLYRGTSTNVSDAVGAAVEAGLGYNIGGSLNLFASAAYTFLKPAESSADNTVTIYPRLHELRGTAGIAWTGSVPNGAEGSPRPVALGLQGSVARNWWDNDFHGPGGDSSISGSSWEISAFASGALSTGFQGLVSLGIRMPYGSGEPLFILTISPSVGTSAGRDENPAGANPSPVATTTTTTTMTTQTAPPNPTPALTPSAQTGVER